MNRTRRDWLILSSPLLLMACQQEAELTPAESTRQSIAQMREADALLAAISDPNDPEYRRQRREGEKGMKQLEEMERVLAQIEANEMAAAKTAK